MKESAPSPERRKNGYFLFLIFFIFLSGQVFSDSRSITLEFPPPQVSSWKDYQLIKIPGLPLYGKIGEPQLPIKTVRVLLPAGENIKKVEVSPLQRVTLRGRFRIKPGGRVIPISKISKVKFYPLRENLKVYASSLPYPRKIFSLLPEQGWKGYRILPINIYPLQYIPSEGIIYFFPKIRITVETEGRVAFFSQLKLLRSKAGDRKIVEREVANPGDIKTYTLRGKLRVPTKVLYNDPGPYDYIIITSENLKPVFQTLVNHKIQRGLRAKVVTVEDIYSYYTEGDNPKKIRDFIKDAYLCWNVDYILLGGDTEVVPVRNVYARVEDPVEGTVEDTFPSDMYYACLDGDWDADGDGVYGEPEDEVDFFAEVYVGRAPVETLTEADNFVSKTIQYENSFGAEYLKEVMLVGEYLCGDPYPETWGGDYKDIIGTLFPEEYNITKRYDKLGNFNNNGEVIIQEINEGKHMINHMGHSDVWMVMWIGDWEFYDIFGDENDIKNEDKCFIYSQGCYAGAFDLGSQPYGYTDECVGENFVRSKYGAFAVVMNARYGWFEPGDIEHSPSQQFDYEFWDAVFNEGIKNLGWANQDSKEDSYGVMMADTSGAYRWCYYELNLLGDPETTFGGAVSKEGRIFFSQEAYKEGDEIEVTVMDMDLNVNHEAIDTLSISLKTESGDEEDLLLTETGKNTGVFKGSLTLQEGEVNPGDGSLQALHGDTLTATYFDEDDGLGNSHLLTTTALADFLSPVISNVQVSEVCDDTATITWDTDEESSSVVVYGTAIPPDTTFTDKTKVSTHSILLTGLTPGTVYYFKVGSEDKAGNFTWDDNDGNYYSFTTKLRVTLFEDDMESGVDGWEVSYDASSEPPYNWYITEHFAYSGTHCWHFCREELYEGEWEFFYYPGIDRVHGYLTSPSIDLTGVTNARLSFYHSLSKGGDQNTWDWGRVEISTDGGSSWETLWSATDTAGEWEERRFDLASYVGKVINLRFHFYCEDSSIANVYPGWFIDDVRVESFTEGEVLSITVTPHSWNLGTLEEGSILSTWSADYQSGEGFFTLTNNGTVEANVSISVSSSLHWFPGEEAGEETFYLGWGQTQTQGVEPIFTPLSSLPLPLINNLSPGENFQFDLKFQAPTSTSYPGVEETINVNLIASSP